MRNELSENDKAAVIFRVQLGVTNIRLTCAAGIIGLVTGHRINGDGQIVLTGETACGNKWQSLRPSWFS